MVHKAVFGLATGRSERNRCVNENTSAISRMTDVCSCGSHQCPQQPLRVSKESFQLYKWQPHTADKMKRDSVREQTWHQSIIRKALTSFEVTRGVHAVSMKCSFRTDSMAAFQKTRYCVFSTVAIGNPNGARWFLRWFPSERLQFLLVQ